MGAAVIYTITAGSRRSGKSLHLAALTAAHIKAGKPVVLASHDDAGNITIEPIVGVPGFDDGRQITDRRQR